MFKIIKLWIDGNVLVELLTKDEAGRYVETFGAAGLPILDGKLRDLEVKLGAALSQQLSPEAFAEASGTGLT